MSARSIICFLSLTVFVCCAFLLFAFFMGITLFSPFIAMLLLVASPFFYLMGRRIQND